MAIVFISPRKRQVLFFMGMAAFLVFILLVAFLIVFLPELLGKLATVSPEETFAAPDVKVNFGIMDSDEVKNLEPFDQIQTEFAYVAKDQNGKEVNGTISAADEESAKSVLTATGLTQVSLKENNIGRSDPFVSYYQAASQSAALSKQSSNSQNP